MYQALYRKYRPKCFSDVIGQDHITKTLRRQVETGRTSHAYLFVGTRGTGKTTCAKILSRALNCEHPVNGDPCNECPSCKGIESGGILDVVEIDAASNNGVDNIRAIRDEAVFSPVSVKKRVYIIDEVHMLSASAFNALLKILEEPPEHLVFILATTELRKIPATILSRCQRFSFKRIMPDDIVKRIKYIAGQEKIEITDGAAALLARLGDGSMRDALSLFDQCLTGGMVDEEQVLSSVGLSGSADTAAIWQSAASGDVVPALKTFEKLYEGGTDPVSALSELLTLIRDMMMVKLAPEGSSALLSGSFSQKALAGMSQGVDTARMLAGSEAIQDTVSSMATVRDKRTAAEICLIKLTNILAGVQRPAEPVYIQAPVNTAPARAATPARQREAEPPKRQAAEQQAPAPWEEEPPPEEFVPWGNDGGDDLPPEPVEREAPVPREMRAQEKTPAAPGGDWWEQVLLKVRDKIEGPSFTFLSDRANMSAAESGGTLTLAAKNEFVRLMVDNSQVKSAVSQAATAILGHPVTVRVIVGEASTELKTDKLDELSRFGNIIKFE